METVRLVCPRGASVVSALVFAALLGAAGPESWIPARWDGGPLEVAHRAKDKSLADPAVRDVIAGWYDPPTLGLLEGTPVNCLLLTFAGGADRETEKKQQQLTGEYAAKARERGMAVLGLVYPGAAAPAVAAAATQAKLDGLVLEGEFPAGFAEQVQSAGFGAPVIQVASSAGALRKSAAPVVAVEGVAPGVGKAEAGTTASATAGLWVDSNLWLVRSFRLNPAPRAVWLAHRPAAGALPGIHLKGVADGSAAGGRWIVALEGGLRAGLLRKDTAALNDWRKIAKMIGFFAEHSEWRNWTPFGTVGIILDTGGPHLDNSDEFLNLVARRQIPYRVIDRTRLTPQSLEGLRAVLSFDVAPPTDDFGVSVFNAPSVLTYVSTDPGGRMLIQMVNFADTPTDSLSIWVNQKFQSAKLYTAEGAPAGVPVKRSGGRTEIAIPQLPVYGALLLE